MKKLLSIFLALIMIYSAFPAIVVNAHNNFDSYRLPFSEPEHVDELITEQL
jgi:hypothetical protein